MESPGSLLPLLLTVTAISLTGVMAPGPVTAIAITKGAVRREAGALVALGHGMVEVPMIALVALGFASVMAVPGVKATVGLLGGAVLVWMGAGLFRTKTEAVEGGADVTRGCLLAGLTTTVANPYWFVWWATVGATLIAGASAWGLVGVAAFTLTHWLCDLGWLSFLSWSAFTSRRFWTPAFHKGVFIACGTVMAGFGIYFIVTGARVLL
ncbi:MAG: LysE family transporter [Dehalococcoidia bacterium]|nr:LysE family transporter [Dehalococcoidia bacterium]